MGRLVAAVFAFGWLTVTGCTEAGGPERTSELAAQGVYGGQIGDQYTVVGSLNHGISLWRNRDVERLYNWRHSEGEFAQMVAGDLSPDERRAVTTDPRTLVLWDTASGAAVQYWATPSAVLDAALLSDGRRVLLGMEDHSALLFDAQDGSYLQTFLHEGHVASVAVSADDRLALTGSEDETAKLWSLTSGQLLQELSHDNPVRLVALSSSGRYAFTASAGRWVGIWDAETGRRLHTLSDRNTGITSATFSDDERYLLIGTVNRHVELWSVTSGQRLNRWRTANPGPWRNNGAAVISVGFASESQRLRALTGDGRLLEFSRSPS